MASTHNCTVLPSGHNSAGLIVTDSSIQYKKFKNLLDPDECEDDLFLGLHPIEETDWKDSPTEPHEMLLRGAGNGHYDAPFHAFLNWTSEEHRRFTIMQILMVRMLGTFFGKVSVNIKPSMIDMEFVNDILLSPEFIPKTIVFEMTEYTPWAMQIIEMCPNVEFWLDDISITDLKTVVSDTARCQNITAVKIDYKTSNIIFGRKIAWRSPTMENCGMSKYLATIPDKDIEHAGNTASPLLESLLKTTSADLIFEVSCGQEDIERVFPWFSKEYVKRVKSQGKTNHAMVKKIEVNYNFLADLAKIIDTSMLRDSTRQKASISRRGEQEPIGTRYQIETALR